MRGKFEIFIMSHKVEKEISTAAVEDYLDVIFSSVYMNEGKTYSHFQ